MVSTSGKNGSVETVLICDNCRPPLLLLVSNESQQSVKVDNKQS